MQENVAITENVIFLPFGAANVPDADGTAKAAEVNSNDYVMNFAGSIIGLAVRHNADLTGGVITWNPTIDGTANTTLGVVTDDTNQQAYKNIQSQRIQFAAGARLGVAWTKTGTVAPTTTDVSIGLLVQLTGMDF